MYKKKSLFVTFEGIEGSGKSYLSYRLFNQLKKKKFNVIHTREPGGTFGAERIRKIILDDYFKLNKRIHFDKYTDTLLYLASRNEHVIDKIKPAYPSQIYHLLCVSSNCYQLLSIKIFVYGGKV